MTYKIIKDVEILNQIVFKKGSIIEQKEIYDIQTESGEIKVPHILLEKFIEPIDDKFEIRVKSLDEDEDEEKMWRLQIDVKTTRKKAKIIENLLRETLVNHI
jgi:hypothetical protein